MDEMRRNCGRVTRRIIVHHPKIIGGQIYIDAAAAIADTCEKGDGVL